MQLTPIPGIRGLGPASAPKIERKVAPAFALDAVDRMEDYAYQERGEAGERGLEEDGTELISDNDDTAEVLKQYDENSTVNLFA